MSATKGAVSIHAPWEGCDSTGGIISPSPVSFNSRTLGRVRLNVRYMITRLLRFQFTHPGKGATPCLVRELNPGEFQFTHPGKGATDAYLPKGEPASVSIHAPWEGCDVEVRHINPRKAVSIHAPWEGCDVGEDVAQAYNELFQFTHPGKGATPWHSSQTWWHPGFNSRTLGRVRHQLHHLSLHRSTFQFTHPGKGATRGCKRKSSSVKRFNSRTLGRVRLVPDSDYSGVGMFQFTHPGKGATAAVLSG